MWKTSLTVADRIALLCHLLMNTRDIHDCSTDDLKMALEADKAKVRPPGKEAVLEDVWTIGRLIEQCNDGQKGEILALTSIQIIQLILNRQIAHRVSGATQGRSSDEAWGDDASGDNAWADNAPGRTIKEGSGR